MILPFIDANITSPLTLTNSHLSKILVKSQLPTEEML